MSAFEVTDSLLIEARDYFDKLKLSNMAERKHLRLEYHVLDNADAITTVSWSWEKDFKELGAKKTATITNGFDSIDFENIE
ncbi:MAG: hypothetical protein JKY87_04870, partial [Mariprofundus sp.]|nr:hypothetical protein [Mariprofundus sp.]